MTGFIHVRSRGRAPARPPYLAFALVVAWLGASQAAVWAELVVLDNGAFLKVDRYEAGDEQILLELSTGGVLRLPLSRIDRIVDDEIVPHDAEPLAEPALRLTFGDGAAVPDTPYGELIFSAAERHALDPELVAAVVAAESAFDPRAVSVKGARGLMQLMPATAERFGVQAGRLFEPRQNLEAGTRYLRWLVDRFEGDPALVLAAYNSGEGTVDRYGGVPPYRETQNYLRRVYRRLGFSADEVLGK